MYKGLFSSGGWEDLKWMRITRTMKQIGTVGKIHFKKYTLKSILFVCCFKNNEISRVAMVHFIFLSTREAETSRSLGVWGLTYKN